jgi:hypothetical protein
VIADAKTIPKEIAKIPGQESNPAKTVQDKKKARSTLVEAALNELIGLSPCIGFVRPRLRLATSKTVATSLQPRQHSFVHFSAVGRKNF